MKCDSIADVADISTLFEMMSIGGYNRLGDVNLDGNVDVADFSNVMDIMASTDIVEGNPNGNAVLWAESVTQVSEVR